MKKYIRQLRQILRHCLGRDLYLRTDYSVEVEVHGSDYGGWGVLSGSLNSDSVVLSFGIGQDVSFDLSLINEFDLRVYGFDPTPASIDWLKRKIDEPKFEFRPFGISDEDGFCEFFLPLDNNISASLQPNKGSKVLPVEVEMHSLATICLKLSLSKIDYMKMDVEGAEYRVICSLKNLPEKLLPRQLGVEFHHFMSSFDRSDTLAAITSLRQLGYRIAWTSASTHEVLFVLNGARGSLVSCR